MNTITEIELAIERLPPSQVDELAGWLDALRMRRLAPSNVDAWLRQAEGAANSGTTTSSVMNLTRGEE